jgi:hypothetical protein
VTNQIEGFKVYRPIDGVISQKLSLDNFLVKNPLIDKKSKPQNISFAKNMGIRNWMKTLFASTTLFQFTIAKKIWSKLFAIFY